MERLDCKSISDEDSDSESDGEFQELAAARHQVRGGRALTMLEDHLFESVVKNRADRLRQLLRASWDEFRRNLLADAVIRYSRYQQPYHWCVHQTDVGIICRLCEEDGPINRPDRLGYSPARLALISGRMDELDKLSAQKEDRAYQSELFREVIVGEKCDYVKSIVCWAFYGGVRAAHDTLDCGCRGWYRSLDLRRQTRKNGEQGVVDCKRSSGDDIRKTALKYAAWSGDCDAAKALLAVGVPPDCKDEDGITPLVYAVQCGHTEVVRCLLQAGACATELSPSGVNLMEIAISRKNMNLLRVLIDFGKTPDLVNENGFQFTALMRAAAEDHVEAIHMLLSSGADKNFASGPGPSALIIACKTGRARATEALLEAGADVNASSKARGLRCVTALMMATGRCKHRCTRQLLLSNKLILNQVDSEGETALHYCCEVNNKTDATLLLRAGIDTSIRSVGGWTASQKAANLRWFSLANLIDSFHITLPSLVELCLHRIRQSLPDVITEGVVRDLPLPRSMREKVLFIYAEHK